MTHPQHPQVQGPWQRVDNSANTLETARTSDRNLIAVRSTYDPDEMIFTTPKQAENFATVVQKGIDNLLGR